MGWHWLHAACCGLALAGTAVALGGLVAVQTHCTNSGGDTLFGYLTRVYLQAGSDAPPADPQDQSDGCGRWIRYHWFFWAYALASILIHIAFATGPHSLFKHVKAASWAVLCSAATVNIGMVIGTWALYDDIATGSLRAAMIAAWSGFLIFDIGAWMTIFSGAARAYFQGTDVLGGLGVESSKPKRLATIARSLLWRSKSNGEFFTHVTTMRRLFLACQALGWAGLAVLLGGVASLQAGCSEGPSVDGPNGETIMLPGRLQNCAREFGILWWAWAFGCFALGMMAFLTASQRAAPYKAAFWSLLIASASYNLCSIIHWVLLYSESKVAGDAFKTRALVAFCGLVIYDAAVLLTLFAGCAYLYSNSAVGLGTQVHRGSPESKLQAQGGAPEAGPGTRPGQASRLAWRACLVGMGVGEAIALVGQAMAQSSLNQGDVPFPPVPAGQLARMYLERLVAYNWYVWALQLFCTAASALVLGRQKLRQFKAAVWLLLMSSIVQNMWSLGILYKELMEEPFVRGSPVQSHLSVAFAGFITWDVCACFSTFAGSALAWHQRNAGPAGDDDSDHED